MTSPTSSPKAGAASTETLEPIWGARMGWLVGADGAGLPQVDFEGNTSGALVARRTVPLPPELLQRAATQPQRVVLMFENGDPRLPLIVGLEQAPSATPMLDAILSAPEPEPTAEATQSEQPEAPPLEAQVDGKRVTIEGADEVVLKCGEASITLRRNGKLIIKGTYVETHSTGVNRIKGGSVQVN
jgi:uncharacterized protein DUF6484